jgi:DNA polymerase-1
LRSLIDADIIVYRFGHECQNSFDFDGGAEAVDVDRGIRNSIGFVRKVVKDTGTRSPVLCFSSPVVFRYDILGTYKHNRKDAPKPKALGAIRQALQRTFHSVVVPGLEGDDVIGILATRWWDRFVICSIDKDLNQVPGIHWNWGTKRRTFVFFLEAQRNFFLQWLSGDPGDGYCGIPGIGPKKAEMLLRNADTPEAYWQICLGAYHKAGIPFDQALEQAKLAKVTLNCDFDHKNRRVDFRIPKQAKEWYDRHGSTSGSTS